MKAKDLKVGMRVVITENPGYGNYGHNQVGKVLKVISTAPTSTPQCSGFGAENEGGDVGFISVTLIEKASFTKADLEVGMRVKYRNGSLRLVISDMQINYFDMHMGCFIKLKEFDADMTMVARAYSEYDIMEVYAAPDTCADFFNENVKGVQLFKREEKTAKELEIEGLTKKAKELEQAAAALHEQIKNLSTK